MDIVVCVRRVPDLAEADVAVAGGGKRIDDADLAWGLNEWDAFAVEEALKIREDHGGSVLAVTVGDEDAEDVLRRALAMGADEALRLEMAGEADPHRIAHALAAALASRTFDLVLVGAMSSDGSSAQTGGMLAGLLGRPYVALATKAAVKEGVIEVQHEVDGGLERIVSLEMPAVVSVQTGINEPRYVSIRGIRKVAGVEIPVQPAAAPDAPRVALEELFLPPTGEGAEILEGDVDEAVDALVKRLREKGVL